MARGTLRRREAVVTDWVQVPAVLDLHRVAFILGKQPETIRKAMVSGQIPGRKVMGEWRARKDELMAYLGYQPWEIARYGYGIAVDRRERLEGQIEAGGQVMLFKGVTA